MDSSDKIEKILTKLEPFMILVIISSFVGVLGGVLGALFIKTIEIFTNFRNAFYYIIFLMPVIGMIIVYITKKYNCNKEPRKLINDAITKGDKIPNYITPTLFVTTALSHFSGASVGRMEAPLKMGGGIGSYIAEFFKLKDKNKGTIIASGVSSLFSAVFGAPLTGTVIACELCISKKYKKPIYILPVLLSACFSRFICFAFGTNSFLDRMLYIHHASYEIKEIIPIVILIGIMIVFALLFNKILSKTKEIFKKIKNEYLRIVIGSMIMITSIYLIGNTLFCGNETVLIEKVLNDNSIWYVFIVKTILTALCLAIGFKGGNIGPAFISGATLGIVLANLMGLDPLMGAAIGAVSLFGGATGCYISALILGVEIFGIKSIVFYIIIAILLKYFINKGYIEIKN